MNDPCERFSDAILSESAPPPEGLDAHVAACPACRALQAAHRAARALPRPAVAALPEVTDREVLGRVQQRRTTRLGVAGAAAVAMVAVVLSLGSPRAPDVPPERSDLFALADGVAELTHRDPLSDDPALRGMGAVADWLAPPRTRSLGLDSIAPPSRGGTAGGELP